MKLNNEIKIGIMVTAVLAMLLVLTFKVGDFNFTKKGYIVKVRFYNIDGVALNAPVRLSGLEVGSVRGIDIVYDDETKLDLTLWLNETAKIREGTKAYVKNMGLLGEKYIELTTGDKNADFIAANSLIIGEEPVNMEQLLAKGDVIATNLEEISKNLNERLAVNGQSIDEIISSLRSATKNIDERLITNRASIDETILHLNAATKNLEELSSDIKRNPWKLLYRGKEKGPQN